MEPKTIAERAAKLGFPGDRADRPQRALCGDAVQRRLRGQGRAADHRRDARAVGVGAAGDRRRRRLDWLVLLAKDEAGYANLCKLVSSAHLDRPLSSWSRMSRWPRSKAHSDGLIALTAGAEGALARLIADGPGDQGERLSRPACRRCSPTGSTSSSPAAATRSRKRPKHALIDLAYARDLPLVATNPAAYPDPSFHAAHDAMLCIAHSAYVESAERVDLVARGLAQGRRGDGRAVRRPARSDRQHRGHRPALRGRRAQARADPAAPVRRRGRDPAPRCAGRAGRSGWSGARAEDQEAYREAARIRARRHHRHGLCRLLPDRRRLHQMGQGRRHSGRARAAARARARWSPGR